MRSLFLVLVAALSAAPPAARAAEPCPDVRSIVTPRPTDFGSKEAWLHEPGWFTPLETEQYVPLASAGYGGDAQLLVVEHGGHALAIPVSSMAYHHVANVHVGRDYPVAFTF